MSFEDRHPNDANHRWRIGQAVVRLTALAPMATYSAVWGELVSLWGAGISPEVVSYEIDVLLHFLAKRRAFVISESKNVFINIVALRGMNPPKEYWTAWDDPWKDCP